MVAIDLLLICDEDGVNSISYIRSFRFLLYTYKLELRGLLCRYSMSKKNAAEQKLDQDKSIGKCRAWLVSSVGVSRLSFSPAKFRGESPCEAQETWPPKTCQKRKVIALVKGIGGKLQWY